MRVMRSWNLTDGSIGRIGVTHLEIDRDDRDRVVQKRQLSLWVVRLGVDTITVQFLVLDCSCEIDRQQGESDAVDIGWSLSSQHT